ncbi:MAG: hypothetical protein HFH86_04020 [Bacilli bacterium]|jgi:hypothetical protein|nr:hypothetical protein [Bacilli bacterium]
MRININTIITLENETRYVVLNGTEYQGKKYFLVMEVDEKKEVIPENVAIMEEIFDGFETFVERINDSNLIIALTNVLKTQL